MTTNYDGTWNGDKIENPGGNDIWNSTSTKTYTASLGAATVTITVEPYDDNGEYDRESPDVILNRMMNFTNQTNRMGSS